MREIKFRGKDLETGEWVYGSLFQSLEQYPAIAKPKPTADGKLFYCLTVVDADTVGQYTGLKDRDGKEIYEGDTVGYRFTDSSFVTGKVVWWGARCGFYIRTRENDYYELTEHCQAIDTFHDNPELLEDEQ